MLSGRINPYVATTLFIIEYMVKRGEGVVEVCLGGISTSAG
jgi:hypothetical protein